MDLKPVLAIEYYGLGEQLPFRVLHNSARQALGRVVREYIHGLLGDDRADIAVDIRKKRRCAGDAAAAFERCTLGSVVAVDESGDQRGVYADDALAKLRRYDAQRHVIAREDDEIYVHIAQLI